MAICSLCVYIKKNLDEIFLGNVAMYWLLFMSSVLLPNKEENTARQLDKMIFLTFGNLCAHGGLWPHYFSPVL